MKSTKRQFVYGKRFVYTIIVAIVLCVVCIGSIYAVHSQAIQNNYEQLHLQTRQFKKDIKLQMESDQENLITLSRVAAKMHESGEDVSLLVNSYKEIGLMSNIGILLPDGNFITKSVQKDVSANISFREEERKGAYISGKVEDFFSPGRYVIRTSAPVISGGDTVAILYGLIELEKFEERYKADIEEIEAQLYVFEAGSGDLLVDTVNPTLDNVAILKERKYRNGFTYEEMMKNISEGAPGYTEYVSRITQEDLYVHYSSIGISDWYIIVARPTRIVFQNANKTTSILIYMFLVLMAIGAAYVFLLIKSERRIADLNSNAAGIRKLLLEINQETSSIYGALEGINNYAKARSTFFADTDGQIFKYADLRLVKRISEKDQELFVSKMIEFAHANRETNDTNVKSYEIKAGRKNNSNDDFRKFMIRNGIKNITFTVIVDRNNNVSMIAILNPKNKVMAKALIEKVGICFSIAIYNRKHLQNTEVAASTDALTGLSNRNAYNNDIEAYYNKQLKNFACIFVDVNELHTFNNRYGHAAGDSMLRYIANTLKAVFYGATIYRMGGDEFLIFLSDVEEETVVKAIETVKSDVEAMNYHISVGYSYEKVLLDVQETVRDAETKMYNDKALYYQKKEFVVKQNIHSHDMKCKKVGLTELDRSLEIMGNHYRGVYKVNLDTDNAERIICPSYIGCDDTTKSFKDGFIKYVSENVNANFRRSMVAFLNYDVIRNQIKEDKVPRITYENISGEKLALSVYGIDLESADTIWVFERI